MSPIYRGTTPISKCYRGTVEISAIYRGTALIWQNTIEPSSTTIPVLPSVRTSAASTISSSVASDVVTKPSGIVVGDLLIAWVTVDSGTIANIPVPTGFTVINRLSAGSGLVGHVVGYRVATSADTTGASWTYAAAMPTGPDGSTFVAAIRDWDGVTTNMTTRFAQQTTNLTNRAIPAISPTKAALVLHSGHHDNNTAANGVWKWQPPQGSILVGMAHNNLKWASQGVAASIVTGATSIPARSWADMVTRAVDPVNMTTTSMWVGAGTTTASALMGVTSGGSGGALTDITATDFTDSTGRTSKYNLYAAGLDWTKNVGILIYTDGSAENGIRYPADSYVMAGADGMIAVAKRNNMILLTPWAPGNGCLDGDGVCWYEASNDGTTPEQKLEWSKQLIDYIYGRYDIDKTRVAIGGYSSGAQWTTAWFGPAHAHNYMLDGVMVAISYGGQPRVTVANTASHKTNVPYVWNVGDLDDAWRQPTWDDSVQRGLDYYRANGYTTILDVIPGQDHSRYSLDLTTSATGTDVGEFGRIMEHYIQRYVHAPLAYSGGGGGTPPASSYVANPTSGTLGAKSDVRSQSYSDGTRSSLYHRSAAHLTGSGPYPLVLHLHGDGYEEYTNMANNVTSSVAYQYEQIAKNNGALFVLPRTPDTTNQTWYDLTSSATWLTSLLNWLKGQYNIDLNRVFLSGFSGGAEAITYSMYADKSNNWTGGGAMILGGGGADGLSFGQTPTAEFKSKQIMRWFVGENDVAGATFPANWSAREAAAGGELFYRNNGFDTALTVIPGKAHNDSEPLGPGYLDEVIRESNGKLGV